MATTGDRAPWRQSENPFPRTAIARYSPLRLDVPTIRTAAVQDANRLIDEYLRMPKAVNPADETNAEKRLADTGKVIVIQGDYGTGKTHLAIELLDRIAASRFSSKIDTRMIYHVASGGSFLTLYTDLMAKSITLREVHDQVLHFYADIVANVFRERPFADSLVTRLEEGKADPRQIIEQYGLREGSLRQELRERLSSVTGDEDFSRALILLLQPALRDAAWRWLSGDAPDPIIAEHGITKPIQSDESALEALGVIALLYGRTNRRFVLVIDEMEKLVLTWDRSREATVQAFKKLLEVFQAAGALLISCGLPDMFEILPPDPGRIEATIRLSPLTVADVRWYIEETQFRIRRKRELRPFTEESISYLVYLSGGNAREIVRFCYRAYEYASESGQEIEPPVIRKIAYDLSPRSGVEVVRNEIWQAISNQGRTIERNKVFGGSASVDFWIPTHENRAGCVIVVSDAILEEGQVKRLEKQLRAVYKANADLKVILVVVGYLAAALRPALAGMLGISSLIVYNPRSFDEDLSAAVNNATGEIISQSAQNPVTGPIAVDIGAVGTTDFRALREETERIGRQQTNTFRLVQRLTTQVLASSMASDERLDGIKRALEASSLTAGERAQRAGALPAALEEMFDAAQRSLMAYGDVGKLLEEVFDLAAAEPGGRITLTYRLRGAEVFTSIGTAAFLGDLLASFRQSVLGWLGAQSPEHDETLITHERERLRGICRTYDALYGIPPLFQLDPLPDVTGLAEGQQELLAGAGQGTRREMLQAAFDGLGDRVYQAAIGVAGGEIDSSSRVAN